MMKYKQPVCILSTLDGLISQAVVDYKEDKQTHSAMCILGANWLRRNHKCRAMLVERGGGPKEMPDVLGFHYEKSYLIEAKISRGDFLGDANKPFRSKPEEGMGMYRYYICPKGLISKDEVPANWGLLWVYPSGMIKRIKGARKFSSYSKDNEYLLLTSALASPWKMFQHWSDSTLSRLASINWVSKNMGMDIKLFCARVKINREVEIDDKPSE